MSTLGGLFPAGGGKTANFTANGAISAGKPVSLNSDGTISEITSSSESASLPLGSTTQIVSSGSITGTLRDARVYADPFNHDRWVFTWVENASDGTDYHQARFITRSGSSLTLGTERTIFSGGGNNDDRSGATIRWCTHTANKFIIGHSLDTVASLRGAVTVVTVSDSGTNPTISMGTSLRWHGSQFGFNEDFIPIGQTGRYLTLFKKSSGTRASAYIFTVTGTTIAVSSTTDDLFARDTYDSSCGIAINPWDPTKGVACAIQTSGSAFYIRPFTIDGTTITMGTERQIYHDWQTDYKAQYGKPHISYVAEDKIYLTIYVDDVDTGAYPNPPTSERYHRAFDSTIGVFIESGSYPEFNNITGEDGTWDQNWTPNWESGSTATVEDGYGHTDISPNTPKTTVHAYYSGSGNYVRCVVGTVNTSNNTVSYGTDTQMDTSYSIGSGTQYGSPHVAQSHGAGGYFLVGWSTGTTGSGYVRLGKAGGTYTNYQDLMTGAGGHIGIAGSAISNAASGSVTLKGDIHTGGLSSLTIGADYYLQANGTVATDSSNFKLGRALTATTIDLEYQS